jgi:tripartite-type tricarboxylate transporter receptor subunit TctC
MKLRLFWLFMVFVSGSFSAIRDASAQSLPAYPQKPVRLVVPFAAGSANDTIGRLLAQGLSERLKGTFVIENRPGANGAIASEYVARSAPDGYTLLMATASSHSQVPWLMKKPPYDAIKDFVPIAGVGGFSFIIVVHPSLPVRSMREFIALAKANPGQIAYGAPGGIAQICAETLRRQSGLELVAVPYKSSPQAVTELMAGQIGMICSDFATAIPFVKAGKIRALAITTDKRSAELPDVATLKESLPDFVEMRSWSGILAPAGLPRELIEPLNREILAVTTQPDFRSRLAPLGFELMPLNARELSSFMQAELAKWQILIKQAGIEPQ